MKSRDSFPISRTKKSPGFGIWSERPTFSQLRKKDRPVKRVDAERCSPGSTCVPPFGTSVFSIVQKPVLRRFIWHFRREFENRSARSPHGTMTVFGSLIFAFVFARRSASLTPSVAEPLFFGPGIFRRSFLPFLHTDGIAVFAKALVAYFIQIMSGNVERPIGFCAG